jgi:hypothetical protein
MIRPVRRRQLILGVGAISLWQSLLPTVAQDADSFSVRIRLDDSAIKAIPLRARQQLTVSEETSPAAQELLNSAPPQKAVPRILIAVGVLAVPIIWDAILEMIREVEYGGVIIDLRTTPPAITNSKRVPAGTIIAVHQDGTPEFTQSQGFSREILLKWLRTRLQLQTDRNRS